MDRRVVNRGRKLHSLRVNVTKRSSVLMFFECACRYFFNNGRLFHRLHSVPTRVRVRVYNTLIVPTSYHIRPYSHVTSVVNRALFRVRVSVFRFREGYGPTFFCFFFCFRGAPNGLFRVLFKGGTAIHRRKYVDRQTNSVFFVRATIMKGEDIRVGHTSFLHLLGATTPRRFARFSFFSFVDTQVIENDPGELVGPSTST